MSELIILLREHYTFGFVFSAHFTEKKNKHFIEIAENVSFPDVERQPERYTEEEKGIIKTIESYSDQNLARIFSKKKKALEFVKSVSKYDIEKRIRPFIEKRLITIIEKLSEADIPMYLKKDKFNTLYKEDLITIQKEPAKTVFNIEKEEAGTKYFLSVKHEEKEINLFGKSVVIISNEPCNLILDSKLYSFADIDGKKLKPFFDKTHISIPKSAERKWFEAFGINAIKKFEVSSKGFLIKEKRIDATAELVLEKDWKGDLAFMLYFHYENETFHSGKKFETKLEFDEINFEFTKLSRNESWEKKIIKKIQNTGLILQADNNFKVNAKTKARELQYQETVEWLSENKHKFTEIGVSFKQDLYRKEYFIQKISSNIKISKKKDWFDIYGTVSFGKFEIPFINLRNHILKEKREFVLPDKTIAIIPDEWFAKYSEIFMFGEKNSDKLKLGKTHFDALKKSEIKGIDKQFKKSISKLIHFNEFETEVPEDIKAELRPYQKDGLKWMYFLQENNFGGCLADDMGLGKTLQTITLLQKTINSRIKESIETKQQSQLNLFVEKASEPAEFQRKASLIVMPISLIHNWKNEIKKFAPKLKVLVYKGSNRHRNINRFNEYDIILAGYALIRNDIDLLKNHEFLYVVLDESQFIKNSNSKTYKAVLELDSEYRLVLTGTPIENSLTDLWSQMNFINNGMLGNENFFNQTFIKPIEKQANEIQEEKLKRIINPFLLRRTKNEVAKDLPPLTEQTIYCKQDEEQKSYYEKEKSKIRNKIIGLIESGEKKSLSVEVLGALTKLRQISNHPVLVDEKYEGESGKFNEIIRNIESLTSENHKVLIFSSFVKHLDLLAAYFEKNNIKYSKLTGQTKKREEVISEFQDNTDNRVFLISIKAGGTGLNLTEADYVFIIDPWWNPAVEKQAVNRAHRIGQDKKVMVYRYISENTIEEKISKLQEKKSKLADTFINNNNPLKNMTKTNILELFK
ncbi:MAG: DEAD/DEAH box helicase [Bacteroidales bacterium]|nr:DEAD/DEAH box helicase [Bacteroidales bacterium]